MTVTAVEHKVLDKIVPLGAITNNPNQPRQHFDPDGLRELAASIEAMGLLQPIVVRPVTKHNGLSYQILF